MTAADLERFVEEQFPEARGPVIEHVAVDLLRLRLPFEPRFLRPGGTLSGPTLVGLADTAAYFLLLANLGPVALAVTSSLTIHFLRKPVARELVAEARPLKLGRRLAVVEVRLFVADDPEAVAQATLTYAIPT